MMGPKRLVAQPSRTPNYRKVGPTVPPKPIKDTMVLSPQDSLAQSGNRKGTGYFLQFEPPKAVSDQSRKRAASATAPQARSRIPVRSPNKKGKKSQKTTSGGTRTRSVSPKVLKKDNNNDVDMKLVADKCRDIASDKGDDCKNSSKRPAAEQNAHFVSGGSMEVHQGKYEAIEPMVSESNPVSHSKAGDTMQVDESQKKADYSSIDQFAINKDSDTSQEPVCSYDYGKVPETIESQPRDLDTLELTRSRLDAESVTSGEAKTQAFQRPLGCQELNLTDDEDEQESETERDSLELSVNSSSPSSTCAVDAEITATSYQVTETSAEQLPTVLSSRDQPVTRVMASSSWMDRLKEVRN